MLSACHLPFLIAQLTDFALLASLIISQLQKSVPCNKPGSMRVSVRMCVCICAHACVGVYGCVCACLYVCRRMCASTFIGFGPLRQESLGSEIHSSSDPPLLCPHHTKDGGDVFGPQMQA